MNSISCRFASSTRGVSGRASWRSRAKLAADSLPPSRNRSPSTTFSRATPFRSSLRSDRQQSPLGQRRRCSDMRFYFPDSQDQIDPSFDFTTEERSPFRIRQRDDRYAHEVLAPVPYTGMLVSKAIVDGIAGAAGRYSAQQRQRLYRVGVREFFRLTDIPEVTTLGDCGAFTYVREKTPPYTVDEVIDFYEGVGIDAGVSPDHII